MFEVVDIHTLEEMDMVSGFFLKKYQNIKQIYKGLAAGGLAGVLRKKTIKPDLDS